MAVLEHTMRLTDEQVAFFAEHGYLVLDQVMEDDELEKVRAVYDELFANGAGRETGDFFDLGGDDTDGGPERLPQMMNPSRYAPQIIKGQFFENVFGIAKQLLGESCTFTHDHAICKPPHAPAETPWHQDMAYLDGRYDYNNISFWIPLQEVTEASGCLQFIPGSHKYDILEHHTIDHNPKIEGLVCDEVDLTKAVACPLPAGGATIHHTRTLHYAAGNSGDEHRRAYILEFQNPPTRLDTPRDFHWNRTKQTRRKQSYGSVASRAKNTLFRVGRKARRMMGSSK